MYSSTTLFWLRGRGMKTVTWEWRGRENLPRPSPGSFRLHKRQDRPYRSPGALDVTYQILRGVVHSPTPAGKTGRKWRIRQVHGWRHTNASGQVCGGPGFVLESHGRPGGKHVRSVHQHLCVGMVEPKHEIRESSQLSDQLRFLGTRLPFPGLDLGFTLELGYGYSCSSKGGVGGYVPSTVFWIDPKFRTNHGFWEWIYPPLVQVYAAKIFYLTSCTFVGQRSPPWPCKSVQ